MATPRVFVSSTCFDLSEVRDSLETFIRGYNFVPVLSDKGDVFYSPDLHSHDACIKEVESCQLFILIIGGRFGGEYYKDKEKRVNLPKSITNKEYLVAKDNNIPVFTFIKRNVMENHLIYKDNLKHNPKAESVYYSAIDKQEYSKLIFEFIDNVRFSTNNNAIFSFDYAREIQENLAKQWAGMFYDFLIERQRNNEISTTNKLIENLTIASVKTEELIKKIITKELGEQQAEEVISNLDNEADTKKFFNRVFSYFSVSRNNIKKILSELIEVNSMIDNGISWHEYLIKSKFFYYSSEIYSSQDDDYKHELTLLSDKGNYLIVLKSEYMTKLL
ncbi:DUF4062 domain-containing protein [Paenibacillus sp. UMB7766-LJ446]|uniref:DUF4062 domain-containing protein n=1 Tax=Paenibacillus sp. UMB7766-LJ446 TaxID=3046313 RepID=UPI00254BD2D3|nr:DUF4062 domain-containing protein [Paenibacillus sp. UMB7766-LJ446]MDK8189209.1 DUF4062 domain-containing protein [Paenibacillus sp. UMB7766-LJ446]